MLKLTDALLLLGFGLMEWVFDDFIAQLGLWSNYAFELLFCAVAALALQTKPAFNFRFTRERLLILIAAFTLGLFVHFGARAADFAIPFDLEDPLTVLLLLAVAPILEELLMRFAIWECFAHFVRNAKLRMLINAGIFSFSHFFFVWSTESDLHPFIYYQTGYTFFLGLACAREREETGGIGAPMLLHFLFNLGFYIGRADANF